MTNLDYIRSLNSKELAEAIFTIILPVGKTYSESRLGIAEWLDEKFFLMDGMSLNYGRVYSFDNFYRNVSSTTTGLDILLTTTETRWNLSAVIAIGL